jgi:hypothetical protein
MIRYRLPHEWNLESYHCKWCGASEEAIEDGRKPRYCAKNRKFKAPGMYISYSSLERRVIEISKHPDFGIRIAAMALDLAEEPPVGFEGWGFPKMMDVLFNQAFEGATRDGVALYNIEHPITNSRLVDPDEWYIKGSPEEISKLKVYDPFRYKFRERLSFDIAKPSDVAKKIEVDDLDNPVPPDLGELSEESLEKALEEIAKNTDGPISFTPTAYLVHCPRCFGIIRSQLMGGYICGSCGTPYSTIEHENGDGV